MGKMRRLTCMRSYKVGGAEDCSIVTDQNVFIHSRRLVEKEGF